MDYIEKYLILVTKRFSDLELITQIFQTKRYFQKLVHTHFKSTSDILEYNFRQKFLSTLSNGNVSPLINKNLIIYVDKFFKTLDCNDMILCESTLMDIYEIFNSCIENKEIFILDYKRVISRRLIMDKSKSLDLESKLVKMLESSVGPIEPLMDIYKMISDVENSRKMSENNTKYNIKFEQLTLEKDKWPNTTTFDLLSVLKDSNEQLNAMYDLRKEYSVNLLRTASFKQKVLNYDTTKGKITLSYPTSSTQDISLSMTENMALVLLLFNTYDTLTLEQIRSLTKLDKEEVYSILFSLSGGKYKILMKDECSTYKINDLLEESISKKSNKGKDLDIKYIIYSFKSSSSNLSEESKEVSLSMDPPDWEPYIQAFIVRLLKHQPNDTILTHAKLMTLILQKYPRCTNGFIKTILDKLINLEFITRIGKEGYVYCP